jgi:hypothetical protein
VSRRFVARAVASAGMIGFVGAVGAVGSFAPLGAGLVGSASASGMLGASGTLVPTHPGQVLPTRSATVDSLNWAGYAVTPGSGITAVDSTFKVPAAGAVPPGFSATWAGIGGYNTSDLIQAGVSENSTPSNPLVGSQYNAWYEILPASETPISGCSGDANCTVNPGDTVSVDIHLVSGNQWSVNLDDSGHWTYSIQLTYASTESSAEWIQEAPTLVVQTIPSNVGTVNFGPTSTYTHGGTTSTIAQGSPTVINESPVGVVNEATTSPLASDGQSFNVCVYAQSCAAP